MPKWNGTNGITSAEKSEKKKRNRLEHVYLTIYSSLDLYTASEETQSNTIIVNMRLCTVQ